MRIKRTYLLNFLLFFIITIILIVGCRENNVKLQKADIKPEREIFDLKEIQKRGKLIALTDNSTTSYFLYKGQPMGYEYELLEFFADHLGVQLEVVVVNNMDEILSLLQNGTGDIIAANLTVTQERARSISFTEPNIQTRQVLVQRKPKGWNKMATSDQIDKHLIKNPIDLIGKKIHVRKNSSFYTRLLSLSDEIGGDIEIMEAPGDFETELLISLVARGDIDYTIADENVALVNRHYHSNIDVSTGISLPQQIAWAVNKRSPNLLEAANEWIKKIKRTRKYAIVYNKYFKNHQGHKKRVESDYFAMTSGKISKYDHILKIYSKEINWDWRLLASLVYQESNFDPNALSWAGAFGLMQLMPATASMYGVDSLSTVAQNVKAGTKYLSWINDYWDDQVIDEEERIKFILASYNVGLGHVMDARNLAIKYDKNPNKWEDHVAPFILKKSRAKFYNDEVVKHGYCRGEETYRYVREILNRYHHYKNIII